MKEELRNYITKNVEEYMRAPMCCAEAKNVGQAWLDAAGGDNEDRVARELVTELQADILPIDDLIAFANSEAGKDAFGEKASEMAEHAERVKAEGRLYCDCAACAPVSNILSRTAEILG